MGEKLVRKILHIDGMTCTSCEMRIENALKKLEGMAEAKAIYSSSNVYVTYDINKLRLDGIIETIEKLDYKVKSGVSSSESRDNKKDAVGSSLGKENKMSPGQVIGVGIIILAIYLIINNTIPVEVEILQK